MSAKECYDGGTCRNSMLIEELEEKCSGSQNHNAGVIDSIMDKLIAAGMQPAGLSWMVGEALDKLAHQWHVITKNEDCPDVSGDYEIFTLHDPDNDPIIAKATYNINDGWDLTSFILAWRNL